MTVVIVILCVCFIVLAALVIRQDTNISTLKNEMVRRQCEHAAQTREIAAQMKELQETLMDTAQLAVNIDEWREEVTTKAKARAEQKLAGREIRRG